MKKFLLLLAAIGMIFSACEQGGVLDEENNGNSTEQPDNGNNGDNGNSGEMIPTNEIWYTSTDGNIVTPYATDVFDANIVSNTYENGQGVITFDGDVTQIGKVAFCYCETLKSITIPDSVTTIGDGAFVDCISLEAFYGKFTSLDNRCLVINNTLIAFALGCGATDYTISNGITAIGGGAMRSCYSITNLTITDTVVSIGEEAICNCTSLETIKLSNNITKIDDWAFFNCTALKSINIPNSITTIGDGLFAECSSLISITIPNSVTSIGEQAFLGCSSLTTFYGKFASADNRCLIIDGVLNSFAQSGLTKYTIPNGVTSIRDDAFFGCTSLKSITIPDSVTSIGNSAFCECTSLNEVYCKPITPPTAVSSAWGWSAFNNNASDRKIYVPRNSVEAYKTAEYWSNYASDIVGYDF